MSGKGSTVSVRTFPCHRSTKIRNLYRVIDVTVYILVIADDRREMQSLLEQRLLN